MLRFKHVLGNSKTLLMLRFQRLQDSASLWWCKELAKVVFAARTTSWKFSCLTHTTNMSSQRRWDPARNLGLVAGTQCVDQRQTWRWHCWKANVICLGLRVAKQFGQPCQLDQRVGKDHVTWNEPGEQMKKLLLSEMEAGRVKNKKPANTNIKRTCVL